MPVRLLRPVLDSPSTPIDWSQDRFDATHAGYNPFETTIGVSNASSLHSLWSVDLGDVMIAQAVEAAGVQVGQTTRDLIYEGTEHGAF